MVFSHNIATLRRLARLDGEFPDDDRFVEFKLVGGYTQRRAFSKAQAVWISVDLVEVKRSICIQNGHHVSVSMECS